MRNERPPPLLPAPPAGTNAKASTAAAAVAGVGAIITPSLLAAVAAVSVGAHAICVRG